jgi:hypothetical protein
MKEENEGRPMDQVIKIDEARIRDHLGWMVRQAGGLGLHRHRFRPGNA